MHLVAALLVALAASPSPQQTREAARSVLAHQDVYQTHLPGDESSGALGPGGRQRGGDRTWARDRGRRGANDPADRRTGEVGGGGPLALIARALMWVLIIVATALGTFWLMSGLSGRETDATVGGDDAAGDEDGRTPVALDRPLGDADALAAGGRFAEAIHVLLLRTLEELARRLPAALPRALTSREVLAAVRLPAEAREALADLVGVVEVTHFGGTTPGAGDYRACLDRYRRFVAAYSRGSAA